MPYLLGRMPTVHTNCTVIFFFARCNVALSIFPFGNLALAETSQLLFVTGFDGVCVTDMSPSSKTTLHHEQVPSCNGVGPPFTIPTPLSQQQDRTSVSSLNLTSPLDSTLPRMLPLQPWFMVDIANIYTGADPTALKHQQHRRQDSRPNQAPFVHHHRWPVAAMARLALNLTSGITEFSSWKAQMSSWEWIRR